MKGCDCVQNTSWELIDRFPVRRSEEQRSAFRKAVSDYAAALGYRVTEEPGKSHSVNLILGDPKTAKYLVTAHYDTCARSFIPNFLIPFNVPLFLLVQFGIVGLMLLASFLCAGVVWLLGTPVSISYWIGLTVYWLLLLLTRYGPANANNRNDNSSGVVTLLELARSLPEIHRGKVCFVLFDKEEAGLVGSKFYRKAHKEESERQIVLNLDCVGDGDELMLSPVNKAKENQSLIQALKAGTGVYGQKSISVHEKGPAMFNSDQKNFPLGVTIAAYRRKKGVGLYVGKFHTNQDTTLDKTNVNILRAFLASFIANDAAVV